MHLHQSEVQKQGYRWHRKWTCAIATEFLLNLLIWHLWASYLGRINFHQRLIFLETLLFPELPSVSPSYPEVSQRKSYLQPQAFLHFPNISWATLSFSKVFWATLSFSKVFWAILSFSNVSQWKSYSQPQGFLSYPWAIPKSDKASIILIHNPEAFWALSCYPELSQATTNYHEFPMLQSHWLAPHHPVTNAKFSPITPQ